MTAPRFCVSCGAALEAGARFCQACGATVGAAAESSPLRCRNCGAELQPGRRFCTSCGTPVDAADRPTPARSTGAIAGIPREKLPLAIGAAAAVVVLVVAVVLLGGGGDGDDSGAFGGGSAVGDELGPDIGVAEIPEPVPVDLPEGDRLLGPNNRVAAGAVRDYLAENGLDLTAVDLFVFPMADVGESLLVIDADLEALLALDTSGSTGEGDDDALARLRELPEVQAANVTRIAMNLRGADEQGDFVMTFTLPIDALDPNSPQYADLSDEQALEVFKVQITR
jgi:hypothetical protein